MAQGTAPAGKLKLICVLSRDVVKVGVLLGRDWVEAGRSAPTRFGKCGFLTSRRTDFQIRVQVNLRVCLVKLGTLRQRKGLGRKKPDHNNRGMRQGGAALALWKVRQEEGGPSEFTRK